MSASPFFCPYMNPTCHGSACGNWNDPAAKFGNPDLPRGCKGDNPTAKWARWYIEHFGHAGSDAASTTPSIAPSRGVATAESAKATGCPDLQAAAADADHRETNTINSGERHPDPTSR